MSEDPEERVLMPRSVPREEDRRPREQRELATLQAQLRALERGIRAARGSARAASTPPGLGLPARTPPRRPHGQPVQLRDGAVILVRPVEPEDAEQLRIGFEHLSEVSRYRRFLTNVDHLSPHQLALLTRVDHRSHEAIAAIEARTGDGIGVARFVRDPGDERQAEFAITIADAWQGRGVGTILFDRLAARALAVGIEVFTARTIIGNDAARRLLAHHGEILSETREAGTVMLTARLRP